VTTGDETTLYLNAFDGIRFSAIQVNAPFGADPLDFGLHTRCLNLRVSDNGRGFDGAACQLGNGLANIRRRATWLGGSAELRASPGEATVITVIAPF
jgi:signal transduction histidine kinase